MHAAGPKTELSQPNQQQKEKIETAAKSVIDVRSTFLNQGQSYAQIYDPDFMPIELQEAHAQLDKAVDSAYSYDGSQDDSIRTAFLFKLYAKIIEPLGLTPGKKRGKASPKTDD